MLPSWIDVQNDIQLITVCQAFGTSWPWAIFKWPSSLWIKGWKGNRRPHKKSGFIETHLTMGKSICFLVWMRETHFLHGWKLKPLSKPPHMFLFQNTFFDQSMKGFFWRRWKGFRHRCVYLHTHRVVTRWQPHIKLTRPNTHTHYHLLDHLTHQMILNQGMAY